MMRDAVASDATKTAPPSKDEAPAEVPSLISESQKRLEEAYKKAEHDKTAALVRIKELEDKLLQAQEKSQKDDDDSNQNQVDMAYVLSLAETEGPQAALEFIKNQSQAGSIPSTPSRTPRRSGVGFAMSPLQGIPGVDTPQRRRVSTRTLTPHPKRNIVGPPNQPPPSMQQVERTLLTQFREAAHCVPWEYHSPSATFVIRRPYGMVTAPDVFDTVSPNAHPDYSRRAHVSTLSTLEVAITIRADNSVMLLYDVAGVRYKTNPNDDWKVVPNVDESDRPLGHVTYIDEQANELEYSLDEIMEEALLVREQYSSTMISTALGFEKRPPQQVPAPEPASEPPGLSKAPSRDVAVETEEKGMMTVPKSVDVDTGGETPEKSSAPPPAEETGSSSDVLTIFIGMILSSILGLVYFVVIGLPLRIVQTVFVFTVAYAILNMLYFYLAQDYNDWAVQQMGGSITSQDLVYYTNMRQGIM
jgi:hypothetical protein